MKNIVDIINEEVDNYAKYLKWKRQNVTLRGIRESGSVENGGAAILGRGLYTAFLSNKALARQYGQVYFVYGAIPKKPKIFNTLNDWEIWEYNSLIYPYLKAHNMLRGEYGDKRDFFNVTTIEDEMLRLGYDGVIIKGREIVNYTPDQDKIRYFENENQLYNYFNDFIDDQNINEETYRVYHGTNQKFSNFDLNKTAEGVVWFTDSKDSISNGSHGGEGNKYIMTRDITLNNPAGWDEYEKYSIGELINMGHDGVILPEPDKTDYIVFDTNNIKTPQINENTYKVYHGTNQEFDRFDFSKSYQGVMWFTDSIDSIKNDEHGGHGRKFIMTRYIILNNPAGWNEYKKYGIGQMKQMGYDGVILPHDNKTDYIVFSNKSIRKRP